MYKSYFKKAPRFYYKILTVSEAEKFRYQDIYHGNRHDLDFGYIQLYSSMEECKHLCDLYYKNIPVHILTLDFKRNVNIISERASDGNRYFNLHGILRYSDVCMEQVV